MPENIDEKALSKGEQTRQSLIVAAHNLFLSKGYHGTSMRQIADQAGLALGGIYNHFANKEEIFAAVLEANHPYKRIMPALEKAAGWRIDEFVRDAAHRVKSEMAGSEEKIVPLAFIELIEFQGKHFAAIVEQFFPTMLAFVQKFGDRQGQLRDIPVPVVLRSFVVLIVGYLITEIILSRVPAIKEMPVNWFDGMIDIYLHGIVAQD
jgi:AcrR family transcriptional regulator